MPGSKDPTEAIRTQAAAFPDVAAGTACNQSSFKTGKGAFLFIGPGAKGVGFKAMFKLDASMPEARKLAEEAPDRFEVGSTGWVTARFTAEEPLPKRVWSKWLAESHALTAGGGSKKTVKKPAAKNAAAKTPPVKKAGPRSTKTRTRAKSGRRGE